MSFIQSKYFGGPKKVLIFENTIKVLQVYQIEKVIIFRENL